MAYAPSMKQLLGAGVHFGHQAKRWNPKMDPYIFTKRKKIHIIDLQLTVKAFKKVLDYIVDITSQGKTILFVGTKRQAQEAIKTTAIKCGMPYINKRWLGGLLTNFTTIQNSIEKLKKIEEMIETGLIERLPKKEKLLKLKEKVKKESLIGGIKNMTKLPDAIFVIDTKKDELAVLEAHNLNIPVIAVLDTNCDPDLVDYGIPGNDDAIRAIQLFTESVCNAIIEGKEKYKQDNEVEEEPEKTIEEASEDESQATTEKKEELIEE